MPVYEFECPTCRGRAAALLPVGYAPCHPDIPLCCGKPSTRIVSAAAFVFAQDPHPTSAQQRQQEWLKSPELAAKLDSGEYTALTSKGEIDEWDQRLEAKCEVEREEAKQLSA